MFRTGLAVETAEYAEGLCGTRMTRRRVGRVKVTDIRISEKDADRLGKNAGRYISIEGDPQERMMPMLVCKALEQLIPHRGTILVAGLGNPDVAYDSLGSRCVGMIDRKNEHRKIAAIETDVAAKTGIDTACMIRAVARELEASCVIAVDALACREPLRAGSTIQISDTGLQPGSGVTEQTPVLDADFVGVPVIAVGVPMVSELWAITHNNMHKGILAAPANVPMLTAAWAGVISAAINDIIL
ncbi:MAG: GPR endopeptidase [Oscillospiraceae bacterium]|nr:GPR endopeptidase [Oscillospiraceae bacterium]